MALLPSPPRNAATEQQRQRHQAKCGDRGIGIQVHIRQDRRLLVQRLVDQPHGRIVRAAGGMAHRLQRLRVPRQQLLVWLVVRCQMLCQIRAMRLMPLGPSAVITAMPIEPKMLRNIEYSAVASAFSERGSVE